MNGVSILLAAIGGPPQAVKVASALAKIQPADEATFRGQLKVAIQGWKCDAKETKQGHTDEGAKRDTARKKDDTLQQPVVVEAASVLPTPPPVAGFGLASAGLEPGSKGSDDSKPEPGTNPVIAGPAADTPIAACPMPKPESIAIPQITQSPVATTEPVKPDSPKELAFALRLAVHRSNQNEEPQSAPSPLPEATLAPDHNTQPCSKLEPNESMPSSPRAIAPPPAMTAVAGKAVAERAPAHGASTPESGSHFEEGSPPGKQPATDATKFEEPKPSELKRERESGVGSKEPVRETRDSSLEAFNTDTATAAPAPAVSIAARASSAVATGSPAEPISEMPAAIHLATPSQVTDIAITVPVSRPDASTDERVAIRMIQKGDEIHVSVRTPDTQLAQSLRQDLDKLSTGLDQAGFHTETWGPAAGSAPSQSNSHPHREPSRDNPSGNGNSYDARSGGQGGRNTGEQRRRQQDERPRWVAALEEQRNQ